MNENTIALPSTIDEIKLIQPNNVTFGQYSLTAIQENVLTLIIDGLQKHMTKEKELPRDLFDQICVHIFCDEAGGKNNKAKVLKEIKKMISVQFSFRWFHPDIHKQVETSGTIITTVHNIVRSNIVTINFSTWAIPYLIYYGEKVGGTLFEKKLALSIDGKFTKRIYKMICRWYDRIYYRYIIDEFRKDFELPEKYTPSQIASTILEPTKIKIENSGSAITFEYKMLSTKSNNGKKPKLDTILFIIHNKNPVKDKGDQHNMYRCVYNWINKIWDQNKSSKPFDVVDKLVEKKVLKDVYNRAIYYQDLIDNKELETKHAANKLKKMLREEYEIE